jgi:hypothetical protein
MINVYANLDGKGTIKVRIAVVNIKIDFFIFLISFGNK